MTQIFTEEGDAIATTLLEVEPICILEKIEYENKTRVKIGCFKVAANRVKKLTKPVKGYFDKLGLSPYKLIKEVEAESSADLSFLSGEKPVDAGKQVEEVAGEGVKEDKGEEVEEGSEKVEEVKEPSDPRIVGLEIFKEGDKVDAQTNTKGRGFTGGMKRHNWSGQPGGHGSTMHRRVGSIGASAYPSRVMKGLRMPGHMGNAPRTITNIKVLRIDKEKNLLFLKGSIPGARGAVVRIRKLV